MSGLFILHLAVPIALPASRAKPAKRSACQRQKGEHAPELGVVEQQADLAARHRVLRLREGPAGLAR
jgi:hypothetical protein